jgi:DNA polymerase III epsilon subunit-like protein
MAFLAWSNTLILTFFDTETTGLDLLDHEIIDIACVRVDFKSYKGTVLEQYNSKIKPKYIERASPIALKINGYDHLEWQYAPTFDQVAHIVLPMLENCDYIVGQNAVFDYRFINKSFDDVYFGRPKWKKYFDTKHMGDQLVSDGKLSRSSLDALCEHYKIKGLGRSHTALVDVLRTIAAFENLAGETDTVAFDFNHPFDPYGDKK